MFLKSAYRDEKTISDRIKILLRFPPPQCKTLDADIEKIEQEDGIQYADNQKEAIKTALDRGILILTGGPGTGKTTTLNGILKLFERQELDIALAAPTGRAAKRMTELTGREAKTIHRLLEVEWDEHDQPVFKRNLRNPLECDALILDELSMVDISVFASLLQALPFGCRPDYGRRCRPTASGGRGQCAGGFNCKRPFAGCPARHGVPAGDAQPDCHQRAPYRPRRNAGVRQKKTATFS